MPWNPCGRIVEWGRRAYTTKARPFRNSDTQVDILWYPAREDAEVLGYDSALNSLDAFEQRLWYVSPDINESPGEPRPYSRAKALPVPTGKHVCGTEQDFAEGGLYDPEAEPIEYNQWGLPLCCPMASVVGGGGVGSGRPTVTYTRSSVGGGVGSGIPRVSAPGLRIVRGGGVGSGIPEVRYVQKSTVLGGAWGSGLPDARLVFRAAVVGGGVGSGRPECAQVTHVVGRGGGVGSGLPIADTIYRRVVRGGGVGSGIPEVGSSVPPVPGTTCATAGNLPPDTSLPFTKPAGVEHWWEFTMPSGFSTWRVSFNPNSGTTLFATAIKGFCGSSDTLDTIIGSPTYLSWNATTGPFHVLIRIIDTGTVNYTIESFGL